MLKKIKIAIIVFCVGIISGAILYNVLDFQLFFNEQTIQVRQPTLNYIFLVEKDIVYIFLIYLAALSRSKHILLNMFLFFFSVQASGQVVLFLKYNLSWMLYSNITCLLFIFVCSYFQLSDKKVQNLLAFIVLDLLKNFILNIFLIFF